MDSRMKCEVVVSYLAMSFLLTCDIDLCDRLVISYVKHTFILKL